MNCIIIEDEPLATEKIVSFVKRMPLLNLLEAFENPLLAIDFIDKNTVDLIFLDIQMAELTGIEFLETINTNAQVVVTTAYSEYALKGYELSVTDYLLKPYAFSRFVQAITKVKERYQLYQQANNEKQFIFVKTEYRVEKVDLENILYIEGMRDYLRLVTKVGNIMTLQRFKAYENYLPKDKFIRVHKSYMIALDKIESIERNRIKIGDKRIAIGETYKEAFNRLLNSMRC